MSIIGSARQAAGLLPFAFLVVFCIGVAQADNTKKDDIIERGRYLIKVPRLWVIP